MKKRNEEGLGLGIVTVESEQGSGGGLSLFSGQLAAGVNNNKKRGVELRLVGGKLRFGPKSSGGKVNYTIDTTVEQGESVQKLGGSPVPPS